MSIARLVRFVTCLVVVLGLSAGALAQESDNRWAVSLGVRGWFAQWDSWNVGQTATGVAVGDDRYEVVESVRGEAELAVIPVLSVRYGSMFASVSAMATTDYKLHDTATPRGFDVQSTRREADVNLGYTFDTGITTTLGVKQIRQSFGGDEYKWRGPVLGIAGAAPLGSGWNLYSSLGFGQLKGTFPAAFPDAAGNTSFDADYQLTEVGFSRSFVEPVPWMNAIVLTIGYRSQRMATTSYVLGFTPSGSGTRLPNTEGELVDVTAGFVVGVQGSF